jgi:predicted Zn finger-like uncharacterized protein
MSIFVRCPECQAKFRVADDKAGKKLRCRECGEVIRVPDGDGDELLDEVPTRRKTRVRSRNRSRKNQTPLLAIGGATLAVLLLVVLVISFRGGASSEQGDWVGDAAQATNLDPEVNLNGYSIQPPRGYTLSYSEIAGEMPSVTYTWTSATTGDSLRLTFQQHARFQPDLTPRVITSGGVAFVGAQQDVYIMHGSKHEQGTINGQKFHRIALSKSASRGSAEATTYYVTYLPNMKIEMQVSSRQGETADSFKCLEAAALTFRVGTPSNPRAVPVQQLLAKNAPASTNRTNVTPTPNSNVTPMPNSNTVNIPNAPASAGVAKSGAIPELSNVVGGGPAFLSYAYQRPEFPGVVHIYPDESYQPKLAIPLPPGTVNVSRPVTPSDFLLVGSQVWNVKTGERVASLGIKIDSGDFAALSPDGKLIAHRMRSNDAAPIAVFSTEQRGQTAEIAARKGNARLEWMGFLDDTRLMLVWSRWNDTRDNAVQIWNAETGEGISAFGLGAFDRNDMTVSSDGQKMLFHTSDAVGYVSLAMNKPKPIPLPMPDRRSLHTVNGLAFSSDNSHAAIYSGSWDGLSILEWDVTKKTIVQNGTVPINASDISFHSALGDTFQWTPDGEHWLIKGHLLLERKSGNPIWMLQSQSSLFVSPILLDQETLLVPVRSKGIESFLVSVPFPWETIRRAKAAMNDPSHPALLRPGSSVSMEFNPGPLRFLPADQMAQVLGQPLADRLKTFGIKVEANQPTVLYVKYQEATGDTLQVVERRSPFDFRGTPTGQTVNETKFQLEIGWKQAGSERVIWKTNSSGSTPTSTNAPSVSDQSIHKEMLDRLKKQLNSLMIPYFISEDETVPLLPVLSTR